MAGVEPRRSYSLDEIDGLGVVENWAGARRRQPASRHLPLDLRISGRRGADVRLDVALSRARGGRVAPRARLRRGGGPRRARPPRPRVRLLRPPPGDRLGATRASAAASISSSETSTSRAASPSGTNESLHATRAMRPANPVSTSSAITPSETPPLRRVSSTTSTRPVAFASRTMSSTGSGASQRRSTTRRWIPCAARVRPPAAEMDPFAQVTIVRSPPSRYVPGGADGHVFVGERGDPALVALARAGRGRGTARSARGRRRHFRHARPTRRRSRASPPRRRAAPATRSRGPGCRAGRRPRRRCGSGRRSRAGSRSRRSGSPSRCGTPAARRTAGSPPRRGAGPRRCGGTRGTGSPGSARSRSPPSRARARGSTSRRAACRRRAPRRSAMQTASHAVTPPLTAMSSPKRSAFGLRSSTAASPALTACARVSGSSPPVHASGPLGHERGRPRRQRRDHLFRRSTAGARRPRARAPATSSRAAR